MFKRSLPFLIVTALVAAACGTQAVPQSADIATATLAPIVSQTPRLTATPRPTRTPIPTFTPVPPTPTTTLTPSDTPTPTEVPPVIGVVNSLQSVNVRNGPGITYREFQALPPGTGVEVIGQSSNGDRLNVLLEDGDEGWIAARLLRLQPTATPFPTVTPTVDETAVALGTVFPTAVIGGGTVTPTPVNAGVSPTPVVAVTRDPNEPTPTPRVQIASAGATASAIATSRGASIDSTPVLLTFTPTPSPTSTSALVVDESVLPVVDVDALNATATALSRAADLPTLSPTPNVLTPDTGSIFGPRTQTPAATPGTPSAVGNADEDEPQTVDAPDGPAPVSAGVTVQEGADVLAYCDDPSIDTPAPEDLAAGSTVDIYWVWYASTEQYVRDHLNAARYEIAIDGVPLRNLSQYRQPIEDTPGDYVVYWYAPVGPLAAGEYEITYRVTWAQQIFDGYNYYGPGTTRAVEEGTCTLTVYEPE